MMQTSGHSASALQQRKCLRRDDSPSLFNHCKGTIGHACQAGMYQADKCSLLQDTCRPCPEGTFSPNWNNCSECLECQSCRFGVKQNCTAERDTDCWDEKPSSASTFGVTSDKSGASVFPSSQVPVGRSTLTPSPVPGMISLSYPIGTRNHPTPRQSETGMHDKTYRF
ncbi:uncharacterized protein [Diadema antillarum]|uniref:uncharacterized protein n=1 Tax=Diadema antillarum TaxID=105358 RepID=UPI003A88D934